MKRKRKQRWSSIQPISTKRTTTASLNRTHWTTTASLNRTHWTLFVVFNVQRVWCVLLHPFPSM